MITTISAERAQALKDAIREAYNTQGCRETLFTRYDGGWSFWGYFAGEVTLEPPDDWGKDWTLIVEWSSHRFERLLQRVLPELFDSEQSEGPTLPFETAATRQAMAPRHKLPGERRPVRAWKAYRQAQWRATA